MAAALAFLLLPGTSSGARPPRPDLHELRLKAPSGELRAMSQFLVRDFVRNDGRATAGRSTVGYFLSLDATFDSGDLRLGGRAVKPLGSGRSSTGRKRLGLPAGVAAGAYRLLACADYLHRVLETTKQNNCVAAPGAIQVQAAPTHLPGGAPDPGPTTPPPTAVALVAPADGSATSAADPAFSGTAAPGAFVTVRVGRGRSEARSLQALPADDGSWSVTAPGLEEGDYTATVTQTDGFGRRQTSDAHAFRVDRTAPSPALDHPADGATTPDTSPTVDGSRGTAAGDSSTVIVKLYHGSAATGVAVLSAPIGSAGAAWAGRLETDLGAGTYTAQVEQSDSAGNVGRGAPHTFQVDDQGPLVTLDHPASDIRTNNQTPTLDGTAEAAPGDSPVTVRIYKGADTTGTIAQTRTAPAGASWSVNASPTLAAGTYTARASQTDSVGNAGASAPHTFTIDRTPPAPTIAHPGGFTGDSTPTFDGTAGTAAGDLAAISVDVHKGANTSGTPVRHLTTSATGGAWSVTSTPALPEGPYTAVVSQPDSAGNTGTSTRAFTVDLTPPAVTVTNPTPGALTSDSKPAFAGTAEAGPQPVTVKVYAGTTATGAPVSTLSASGASWNAPQPTALSDGQYTVVAEQTDQAGNRGTSSPRTFTIDTAGPQVTLTQPANGAITNHTTPTFGGTAEDTTQVTVKVYLGTSVTRTLTVTPSGGNWSVTPVSALPQGTYTVQAEQRDNANNLGQSTVRQFEVDTTAPTLTMTVGASATSVHAVADDSNFASLACTADGSPATIAPTAGSTHKAEGDVNVTGDGTHTVACTATDRATNSTSDSKTFTLDTTAPVVGLTSPAAGTTTDDPTPTFAGPAGTAAGDAGTVTLKVWTGTGTGGAPLRTLPAPVAGSAWAVTDTTNLPEGTYTARAEQADAASNTGFSPTHTFTIGPAAMLAAGDIGGCEPGNDAAGTAAILRSHPEGLVQTLGDNVYGNNRYTDGSLADFQNCFGPNWGTEKPRTKPAIGNHEYNDPNAGGYFGYFGAAAGQAGKAWYSYELGAWHVVVLNSNCSQVGGCSAGSDQEKFLKADLQAHPAACTMAIWHHPRFTSDQNTGLATNTGALWTDLYDAHADLILNGHAHEYERFGPQSPSGDADVNGVHEIVAGMGGESHSTFGTIRPNSILHDNTHFGVLQLTLHQGSWSSSFLPSGGGASLDNGGATCRP